MLVPFTAAGDGTTDQYDETINRLEKSSDYSRALRREKAPPKRGFLVWARHDSNVRPTDYESAALTS